MLKNPDMYQEKILQFRLTKLERQFTKKYGVTFKFTPGAARLLDEQAQADGKDILDYCEALFTDYEHGLNLLRKTLNGGQFVVDEEVLRDPAAALEQRIKETYL